MNGPSGQRSREPFAIYDPDSCCWRTSLLSFPLASLPEPSVTWPRSGTWDRGGAYELPTSELPIGETGSSSLLATPTASIATGGAPQDSHGKRDLRLDLLLWRPRLLPTPTSRDEKGPNQRRDETCLHGALLPTPRATDGEKGSGEPMLPCAVAALLPTPTAMDSRSSGKGQSLTHGTTLTDAAREVHGARTPPPSDGGNE